jgi:hypothetical protein
MDALVIDRRILPEPVCSFIGFDRIRMSRRKDGDVLLSPAGDESDGMELAARHARRRAAFDEIPIDLTGFKFDRDEANDYE